MSCAIRVEGLQKSYAGRAVLKGLTFTVEQGEIFALLGVNGAGKTTLLDVIQGKIRPRTGRVKIGHTVKFGVLSQQLHELDPYETDTIREVLSRYKRVYVVDGKETSPEKLLERLGLLFIDNQRRGETNNMLVSRFS